VSLRRLAHAAEVTRPAVEFESFGTSAGARDDSSGSPNLDCAWVSLNRYGFAKTGRKIHWMYHTNLAIDHDGGVRPASD
jgi:hypothetical protein